MNVSVRLERVQKFSGTYAIQYQVSSKISREKKDSTKQGTINDIIGESLVNRLFLYR